MSQQIEIRRARPLLGTIVEICVRGSDSDILNEAIISAFVTIEKVQRLMSYHEPQSEVSILNRKAAYGTVAVHPWTYEVISFAQNLSELTDGVFDIAVGRELQLWEFLLPSDEKLMASGSFKHIFSPEVGSIQFNEPLAIDLGGIAKGFAVDKAIEALRNFDLESGIVNAGGDLRVFGKADEKVYLRSAFSNSYVRMLSVRDEALATSSPALSKKRHGGMEVSPLLNGQTRKACTADISISVKAPTCMTADALTKVVISSNRSWSTLLQSFKATAFRLDQSLLQYLN